MIAPNRDSVVVVGGGIIGIACAHYLRNVGFAVTVIDKEAVGGACSHANCGYICPSHVSPLTEPGAVGLAMKSLFDSDSPFRVKPTLNPKLLSWMWQFARRCNHQQVLDVGKHLKSILDASMREYQRLIPELELDCEWKNDGLLYVFQSGSAMNAFGENARVMREHFGVTYDWIDGTKLSDFDPGLRTGLAGAFHYPGDTSVRPDLMNRHWVERLRGNGVEFIENCQLDSVWTSKSQIDAISTSQGDITAGHYVFAIGAWSKHWSKKLRCELPVQPGKGYSVTMSRPRSSPRYPMLFPEHKIGVSPFENGLRLGSMMEFVGFDKTIPPRRIQQLRDSARPYLVASVDGEAQETWFGWRPMTWDSLPIIGQTGSLSNAYLATGHNMLGLSMAPSTGKLVTELMTGQLPHIDPSPFRPDRF